MPARVAAGNIFGIRIRKTMRKDGAWVWPDGYHALDKLLRPVEEALRPLWWVLADVEYVPPRDVDWSAEPDWLPREDDFVPATQPRVARPGYLPKFSPYVSGDWTILYGVPHDPRADAALLAAAAKSGWFDPPRTFPLAVSVAVRAVDWAYWEFFAREHALVRDVYEHLRRVEGLHVMRSDFIGNFNEDIHPRH